ncbi:MAG: phosphoribosyl-ATP pyrophosphatase [Acetobacter sp.]|jgi:phosphoribosyl-ATP pyrophosphohydrolase|nr:phosphoribosyl-ATP pyrophosphatase [Acetobacter sp.]
MKSAEAPTSEVLQHFLAKAARNSARLSHADRQRIITQVGQTAIDCTASYVAGDQEDIVRDSAAFIELLASLWIAEKIDPAAVWNELHARIEAGEVYRRLSRIPDRKAPRRRSWRVTTTKLP